MKHKKISLKNKIFLHFLLCSIGIVILIRNLDYLYQDYLMEKMERELWERVGVVYFAVSILILVFGALIFYRRTRKALNEESERRVREQNLIYAALAHDLKTPMTSVQGFAKALSDGKVKPEEQQEILSLIYRKSDSMNEMINTLFEYAKLGTEGYTPNLSNVDLATLVRDIVAENYCDLEEHDIDLTIDIPDEALMIKADKTELKRAITNLIVNIYKHNPDGIKAKVSVLRSSGRAELRVADSGNALPEGIDIFEPFVTENTARTAGCGTGLGLAVTKKVIEGLGGEIFTKTSEEKDYTKAFVIRMKAL